MQNEIITEREKNKYLDNIFLTIVSMLSLFSFVVQPDNINININTKVKRTIQIVQIGDTALQVLNADARTLLREIELGNTLILNVWENLELGENQ
jgi:hypothetical protein